MSYFCGVPLFAQIWPQVKAENAHLSSVCELGAIVGSLWRDLDPTQKQEYNELYAKDKVTLINTSCSILSVRFMWFVIFVCVCNWRFCSFVLCHLCGNIYTSICVSKAVQLELQHIHNKSKYVAYFLISLMSVLLINNMCSKIIYLATFIIHTVWYALWS